MSAKLICEKDISANPLDKSLPLFVSQVLIIYALAYVLQLLFFMVRPPRFISEIMAGVIFSKLNRTEGRVLLETFGNFGLFLQAFLLGLEVKEIQKEVVGFLIPTAIGIASYFIMPNENRSPQALGPCLFWGLSLSSSVTNINNVCALFSIPILIPIAIDRNTAIKALASFSVFVLVLAAVRDFLHRRYYSRQSLSDLTDFQLVFILACAMISGCIADAIGVHSLVGAFALGLIIPNGFSQSVLDRVHGFVSEVSIPIYFATTGIKADFTNKEVFYGLLLGSSTTFLVTVVGFMVAGTGRTRICDGLMVARTGLYSHGVLPFIVINVGLETNVLTQHEFTILMVSLIISTILNSPSMYFCRLLERKNNEKLTLPLMWCTTMGPRMNRLGERFWTPAMTKEFIAKGRM